MEAQDSITQKIQRKFDADVTDVIRRETSSFRLKESGQVRLELRRVTNELVHQASLQVEITRQIQLLKYFVSVFMEASEYDLALEFLEILKAKCEEISDQSELHAQFQVETIQRVVRCNIDVIRSYRSHLVSPMTVSKLVICLKELREALSTIFDLTSRQQEGLSWLVLNCCKLIYEISQPLLFTNCGKYAIESVLFAEIAMEGIINLCTARHMQFRMKLFATAFYALLAEKSFSGACQEASAVWSHAMKQFQEFKEREELDPPIPAKTLQVLADTQGDLAIMQICLLFWKDPDSLDITKAALSNYNMPSQTPVNDDRSHSERTLMECIRAHQLTANINNETRRRRTNALLVAFRKYSQTEGDSSVLRSWKLESLVEVMMLVLFDGYEMLSTESPYTDITKLLLELIEEKQQTHEEQAPHHIISFLLTYHKLVLDEQHRESDLDTQLQHTAELSTALSDTFDNILSCEDIYLRSSFVTRLGYLLWCRYVYPRLQVILSSDRNSSPRVTQDLHALIPSMKVISRCFHVTHLEDSVVVVSSSILYGLLLRDVGDLRGAISWLKESLDNLDEIRASRVDLQLHLPQDIRDVSSLQRLSFTTRSEAQDWFHSIKRLGAHAFAGFGIFGLGSSCEHVDKALAEFHGDLMALYFRSELEYSLERLAHKVSNVGSVSLGQTGSVSSKTSTQAKTKSKGKSTVATPSSAAATTRHHGNADTQAESESAPIESLPCMQILKAYVAKNGYAKALLYMEMARLESNPTLKSQLLQSAFENIEDCEVQERVLADAFGCYTILRNGNSNGQGNNNHQSTPYPYPLVLSRSHRSVYVAPVVTTSQGGKQNQTLRRRGGSDIHGFRVLAKEQGSGTAISTSNINYPGCERVVTWGQLESIVTAAVKIDNLRPGERYVFGVVGVSEQGSALSDKISETSPVVDAVNPLSTIMLWGYLSQCCRDTGFVTLAKKSAAKIVQIFFQTTPKQDTITLGNGVNMMLGRESVLCMLSVQQATKVSLQFLVKSYILWEDPDYREKDPFSDNAGNGDKSELGTTRIHWVNQNDDQIKYLSSLRRCCSVAMIASGILNSHESLLEVLLLGYNILIKIVETTDLMSNHLQDILCYFITLMQLIQRQHWKDIEHILYIRFTYLSIFMSLRNHNISPMSKLLDNFLNSDTSAGSSNSSSSAGIVTSEKIRFQYLKLTTISDRILGIVQSPDFTNQMKLFLNANTNIVNNNNISESELQQFPIGNYWKSHSTYRISLLRKVESSLVSSTTTTSQDIQQLDKWIRELPYRYSEYLEVVVALLRELSRNRQFDLCFKVVEKFPIFDQFLAGPIWDMTKPWNLHFVKQLPKEGYVASSGASATATDAKAAPAGKGGKAPAPAAAPVAAPAATSTDPIRIVPERFENCTSEEVSDQLRFLAEISYLLAEASQQGARRDHFPADPEGPYRVMDPDTYEINLEPTKDTVISSPRSPRSPRAEDTPAITMVDTVRYLCYSIVGFSRVGRVLSSISGLVRVWNLVVNRWLSPEAFVRVCLAYVPNSNPNSSSNPNPNPIPAQDMRTCLVEAMRTLLYSFESLVGFSDESFEDEKSSELFGTVNPNLSSIMESSEELGSGESKGPEGSNPNPTTSLANLSCNRFELSSLNKKEALYLSRQGLLFLTKALWLLKEYPTLVDISSRLLQCFMVGSPEFSLYFGDACFPFLFHAQREIITSEEGSLANSRNRLTAFVNDWEEAQKKKRKKKLRIARLEKDEDEVRFEMEKSRLESLVEKCESVLRSAEIRFENLESQKKKFQMLFSTGVTLFAKLRSQSRDFVRRCQERLSTNATNPNLNSNAFAENSIGLKALINSDEILNDELNDILDQFNQLSHFLREKRDRDTLLQSLHEQGDLLVQVGFPMQAKKVYHDAIDGVLNLMDTHLNWQRIFLDSSYCLGPDRDEDALERGATTEEGDEDSSNPNLSHSDDAEGDQQGTSKLTRVERDQSCLQSVNSIIRTLDRSVIVAMIAILGKLSRFTANNDMASRVTCYCRFACFLSRVLFEGQAGHPKTLVGFAAYECRELGGTGPLAACVESQVSSVSLTLSMEEIGTVMLSSGLWVESLPLLVVEEHFHAMYTQSPVLWVRSRLRRIDTLVKLRFFAEAASMLSGVKPTMTLIDRQMYSMWFKSPDKNPFAVTATGGPDGATLSRAEYELAPNGLLYFGMKPFFNHLSVEHESNRLAVAWISTTAVSEIKAAMEAMTIDVPFNMLSESEKEEFRTSYMASKSQADAGKKGGPPPGKGGKGAPAAATAPEEESGPLDLSHIRVKKGLFPSELHIQVNLTVVGFLLELVTIDRKLSAETSQDSETLKLLDVIESQVSQGVQSLNMDAAVGTNPNPAPVPQAVSPGTLSLYLRLQLMRCRLLHRRFQIRNCRSLLVHLLTLYHHPMLTTLSEGLRNTVTDCLLQSKQLLMELLIFQSRFKEALTLSDSNLTLAYQLRDLTYMEIYHLQRARVYFALGKYTLSLKDTAVISDLSRKYYLETLMLIESRLVEGNIYRMLSSEDSSRREKSLLYMKKCYYLLQRSESESRNYSARIGFLGEDTNMTLADHVEDPTCAIARDELLPEVLFNLTSFHRNESLLTLQPNISEKKYWESRNRYKTAASNNNPNPSNTQNVNPNSTTTSGVMDNSNPSATTNQQSLPSTTLTPPCSIPTTKDVTDVSPRLITGDYTTCNIQRGSQEVRLGPVDQDTSRSVLSYFGSIYQRSTALLLLSMTALCEVMEDLRHSGLFQAHFIKMERLRMKRAESNGNVTGKQDSLEYDDFEDKNVDFKPETLFHGQVERSENALKLLRYIGYSPLPWRLRVLLSVGKTRFELYRKLHSNPNPNPNSGDTTDTWGSWLKLDPSHYLSPLTSALTIAMQSFHPWKAMIAISVQLIECYGSPVTSLPINAVTDDITGANNNTNVISSESALRNAVLYLMTAIQLNNQYDLVNNHQLDLMAPNPNVTLPSELDLVLSQCSYSSSQPLLLGKRNAATAATGAAPAAASKGKGAPAPSGGAGGVGAGEPRSLRDALFVLSSIARETEGVYVSDMERGLYREVFQGVKKCWSAFVSKCCLSKLPSATDDISVYVGSVATLWTSVVPAEGLDMTLLTKDIESESSGGISVTSVFGNVTGYFLLGAKPAAPLPPAATAATAAAPAAKGGKAPPAAAAGNTTATTTSKSDPVLTKVTVSRAHLALLEKATRDLRDRYLDADSKGYLLSVIRDIATDYSIIICAIIELFLHQNLRFVSNEIDFMNIQFQKLFQNSEFGGYQAVVEEVPNPNAAPGSNPNSTLLQVKVPMRTIDKDFKLGNNSNSANIGNENHSQGNLVFTVHESNMKVVSEILSFHKANASIVDNEMCTFLRFILGFDS